MSNLSKHLKTIRTHRKWVGYGCRHMGIPFQGLLHDLSKYSFAELSICKYYTGKGSPHQVARETIGYSPSWTHHYHRNKHHYQFWWDEDEYGKIIPCRMPFKYIIEMYCDMVGAGKAYAPDKWTTDAPWAYYIKCCKDKRIMHAESVRLLEVLFVQLKYIANEKEFFKWYKQNKKSLKKVYTERKILDVFPEAYIVDLLEKCEKKA